MKQVGQTEQTSSIPYKEITLLHKTRALFLEDLYIFIWKERTKHNYLQCHHAYNYCCDNT